MAALGDMKLGLIDNWLRHIRDVRAKNSKELESIPDVPARAKRLAELKFVPQYSPSDCSVLAQVNSAKRIPTVQDAIEKRGLQVHGWVYDVATGLIKPLETGPDSEQQYYHVKDSKDSLE